MSKNYYCLVAGLREYSLESESKGFDAPAIVAEIREELSGKDSEYLELFYGFYDIENIVSMIAGRTHFSPLGNYTREQLEQEIKKPEALPKYIREILAAYAEPEDDEYSEVDVSKAIEKSLFGAYYRECGKRKCRFIREWYEFDRNLRNVIAAFAARRMGIPVAETTVGDGYVVDVLSRSSAADFGLKGELDYLDQVMAATAEQSNLIEKERRVDIIRWEMAEELTAVEYFNLNKILGYLAKVNIVYRWVALDPQAGREMFQRLLASLGGEEPIRQKTENK